MNIGIIVDNDFNTDIRVTKEVSILRQYGYKVHVLCFAFKNETYPEIDGLTIRRINISKKKRDTLFFFFNRFPVYEFIWKNKIKQFILDYSIELLHVHDLYMSKAAHMGRTAAKPEIPMILDLHENYPAAIQSYNWTSGTLRNLISKPKAWLKKEEEYLGYASKIIVLSDFFKAALISKYSFLKEDNIAAFANVIDFRRFESFEIDHSIKKNDKVTLLYFGAVAERRGIFEALRAVHEVAKDGLDIELLIIGPVDKADKTRFFNIINDDDYSDIVRHLDWIDISELTTYLHLSDICLSPLIENPQHESGVANKIFQYMFGSKPLIVSDCLPQKELVESYDCGLAYSTQAEFVQAIKLMAEDRKSRERLGSNGYRMLYKNYNNEDYENILLGLYRRIEQES